MINGRPLMLNGLPSNVKRVWNLVFLWARVGREMNWQWKCCPLDNGAWTKIKENLRELQISVETSHWPKWLLVFLECRPCPVHMSTALSTLTRLTKLKVNIINPVKKNNKFLRVMADSDQDESKSDDQEYQDWTLFASKLNFMMPKIWSWNTMLRYREAFASKDLAWKTAWKPKIHKKVQT